MNCSPINLSKFLLVLIFFTLTSNIHAQADHSIFSEGYWVKIKVPECGIYRLDYDTLMSWGFDPENISVLGNTGNEVSIEFSMQKKLNLQEIPLWKNIGNDSIFNSGDYYACYLEGAVTVEEISKIFFTPPKVNRYSNCNYYFIGNRKATKTVKNHVTDLNIQYRDTVTTYINYIYKYGFDLFIEGRTLDNYGDSIYPGKEVIMPLPEFIVTKQSYTNIRFLNPQNEKGLVRLQKNNIDTLIGLKSNSLLQLVKSKFDTLKITFPLDDRKYSSALNSIFVSGFQKLKFTGDQTTYYFNDLWNKSNPAFCKIYCPTNEFKLWHVKNISTIENITLKRLIQSYGFHWDNNLNGERFIAFNDSSLFYPTFENKIQNQDLLGLESANYLIITVPELITEAEKLAEYRTLNDGYSTLVVSTDKLYNQFSSGKYDPGALYNFIKYIYHKGQNTVDSLQFLLLFGDSKIDCYPCNNRAIIPVKYSYIYGDDYFGTLTDTLFSKMVSGNSNIDIAIGRLPVKTKSEAMSVVEKIKAYNINAGIWQSNITMIADEYDTVQNFAFKDSQIRQYELITRTNLKFNINTLYLDDYQDNNIAKHRLFELFNQGQSIVSYFGHSSHSGWNHELLTIDDIQSMNNSIHPFLISMSCSFAPFDLTPLSAGEALVLNPGGGAVGVLANTRLGSDWDTIVSQYIFNEYLSGERCIGKIMRNFSSQFQNQAVLLCDPALMLPYLNLTENFKKTFENDLCIYPSITKKFVHVSSAKSIEQIIIFDVLGIRYQTITNKQKNGSYLIDMEKLKPNIYLFRIKYEDSQSVIFKIIKK